MKLKTLSRILSDQRIIKLSELKTHKIKSGETISGLANNDPLHIKMILEANPSLDPNKLSVGQEIIIPAPPTRPNSNLQPSQKILDFIKMREGDVNGKPLLSPYDDGSGNITIGWGHNLGKNISSSKITLAEAENLFHKDIETAASFIRRNVLVPLDQNKFDALVSLVFNAGGSKLMKTEFFKELEQGNFISALKLIPTTLIGQNQKGLVQRRIEEAAIFSGIS